MIDWLALAGNKGAVVPANLAVEAGNTAVGRVAMIVGMALMVAERDEGLTMLVHLVVVEMVECSSAPPLHKMASITR